MLGGFFPGLAEWLPGPAAGSLLSAIGGF